MRAFWDTGIVLLTAQQEENFFQSLEENNQTKMAHTHFSLLFSLHSDRPTDGGTEWVHWAGTRLVVVHPSSSQPVTNTNVWNLQGVYHVCNGMHLHTIINTFIHTHIHTFTHTPVQCTCIVHLHVDGIDTKLMSVHKSLHIYKLRKPFANTTLQISKLHSMCTSINGKFMDCICQTPAKLD